MVAIAFLFQLVCVVEEDEREQEGERMREDSSLVRDGPCPGDMACAKAVMACGRVMVILGFGAALIRETNGKDKLLCMG